MVSRVVARDHGGIAEWTDPVTAPQGGTTADDPVRVPGATDASTPTAQPLGAIRTSRRNRVDGPWHHTAWRSPSPDRTGPPWHHPRQESHGHRGLLRLRGMRRTSDSRVLAGVCGGLSRTTGIDVTILRIGAVLVGLAAGFPVLIYAVAWLIVPLDEENSNIFSRALSDRRGIRLVISVIPVVVVTQVIISVLHIGFVGIISWPVFLAAGLTILIWRNASEPERVWIDQDLLPMLSVGSDGGTRWKLVLRVGAGALLAAGGLVVLILGHTTATALRPLGGALLVIAAIVVIFGPWWLTLARDLMSERQARALAEERAQMAAHVHDSVLQTLALIQRSSDDPQHVVRLARAQERELRAWLFEGRAPGSISEDATTLSEGIGLLQRQVEADHGLTVQVVLVGDCNLTDGLRALLDAAREATVNAAKWSGAPQVSLYAEVEPTTVTLFVRDRGRGFDPDNVPADRQGISQSITARVARHGGVAAIRSTPGEGTEVELTVPAPSPSPSAQPAAPGPPPTRPR
jgi:signal transduction histidine kinase/phage shock protein PspC (stress-responsive transcriptional regulator)